MWWEVRDDVSINVLLHGDRLWRHHQGNGQYINLKHTVRAHTHTHNPVLILLTILSSLLIQQLQITHFAGNIIKADRRCP